MYGLISFPQLSMKMRIICIPFSHKWILELRKFNLVSQGDNLITGRVGGKVYIRPSPNPMLCSGHQITPKGTLHT